MFDLSQIQGIFCFPVCIAIVYSYLHINVGIGGHSGEEKGDEQFEIDDTRSVDEVYQAIIDEGLQPVMNDYIYV